MTNKKNQYPLKVSPQFKNKMDELYRKLWENGKKKTYVELTDEIINSPIFKDIENSILTQDNQINFDIKVKLDRRFL